jgi:hypothetical protein
LTLSGNLPPLFTKFWHYINRDGLPNASHPGFSIKLLNIEPEPSINNKSFYNFIGFCGSFYYNV